MKSSSSLTSLATATMAYALQVPLSKKDERKINFAEIRKIPVLPPPKDLEISFRESLENTEFYGDFDHKDNRPFYIMFLRRQHQKRNKKRR